MADAISDLTHSQTHIVTQSVNQQRVGKLHFTITYPVRGLQAHKMSWRKLWETERWRIWRLVDCTDNTERLLLKQVQRLDTDHTACTATRSVWCRED